MTMAHKQHTKTCTTRVDASNLTFDDPFAMSSLLVACTTKMLCALVRQTAIPYTTTIIWIASDSHLTQAIPSVAFSPYVAQAVTKPAPTFCCKCAFTTYLYFCWPFLAASPFAIASSLSVFSTIVVVHCPTLACWNGTATSLVTPPMSNALQILMIVALTAATSNAPSSPSSSICSCKAADTATVAVHQTLQHCSVRISGSTASKAECKAQRSSRGSRHRQQQAYPHR
mmetsp:Transcript_7333/g.14946  ORF Transcript_7333/g.14946 Transcript_7333/m.14946 type:complete len:228 (-) Transcript_7333:65-748(-)